MQKHLRDFIWMRHAESNSPPEKIAIDHSKPKELNDLLSQKMVAGYVQVDPDADQPEAQPEIETEPVKEPLTSVNR
jgi:hypothetical protein